MLRDFSFVVASLFELLVVVVVVAVVHVDRVPVVRDRVLVVKPVSVSDQQL